MEKLHLQPSIQEKKRKVGKRPSVKCVRHIMIRWLVWAGLKILHFIQTIININEYNIISQHYKAILALMGTSQ